jgi:hypothetical protein
MERKFCAARENKEPRKGLGGPGVGSRVAIELTGTIKKKDAGNGNQIRLLCETYAGVDVWDGTMKQK